MGGLLQSYSNMSGLKLFSCIPLSRRIISKQNGRNCNLYCLICSSLNSMEIDIESLTPTCLLFIHRIIKYSHARLLPTLTPVFDESALLTFKFSILLVSYLTAVRDIQAIWSWIAYVSMLLNALFLSATVIVQVASSIRRRWQMVTNIVGLDLITEYCISNAAIRTRWFLT